MYLHTDDFLDAIKQDLDKKLSQNDRMAAHARA